MFGEERERTTSRLVGVVLPSVTNCVIFVEVLKNRGQTKAEKKKKVQTKRFVRAI
jgi:hypothetical protein